MLLQQEAERLNQEIDALDFEPELPLIHISREFSEVARPRITGTLSPRFSSSTAKEIRREA
jgi:hypothetical protein